MEQLDTIDKIIMWTFPFGLIAIFILLIRLIKKG